MTLVTGNQIIERAALVLYDQQNLLFRLRKPLPYTLKIPFVFEILSDSIFDSFYLNRIKGATWNQTVLSSTAPGMS